MAKPKAKKGRTTTPPFENYPAWTSSKWWSFLRSALRSASSRYPPKYECLNLATRPYVGPDKRRKKERQCAQCKQWFSTTMTQADHIVPAGRLADWDDLVPFVQRMFCSIDGFQCLCSNFEGSCHSLKTLQERQDRLQDKRNLNPETIKEN